PKPRHHPAKGSSGHWSAALAHENISSGFLFALETAQGAKFDAGQWVDGRDPIFKSIDVQAAMDEIGLIPAQRNRRRTIRRRGEKGTRACLRRRLSRGLGPRRCAAKTHGSMHVSGTCGW